MSKPIRQVLSENIKTLMAVHPGMTVTSLARDAGLSRGQVNNILTQKSATTIDAIESLAEALNSKPGLLITSPESLIDWSDEVGPVGFERQEVRKALIRSGEYVTARALDILDECFLQLDDEARLALLRVSASMLGWFPDLEGLKMPRDWRDMAWHIAHDFGWEALYPTGRVGNEGPASEGEKE